MLKKVFFLIEYLPAHELGSRVFMELWMQGIEAQRVPIAESMKEIQYMSARDDVQTLQQALEKDMLQMYEKEGLLIVTDMSEVASFYRKNGYAVLGYLHEKNKDASFHGVSHLTEDFSGIDASYCRMVYARAHKLAMTILETKRCIVREMVPEDMDRLYEIYAESEITQYLEPLYEDRQEEAEYIHNYIEHVYAFYGYGMWVIVEKESGSIIGRAGLEPKEDRVELGYVIALPWQKQGYAREVCREILIYADVELSMEQVFARVHRDNLRSVKLCKELGFTKVGNEGEEILFQLQI